LVPIKAFYLRWHFVFKQVRGRVGTTMKLFRITPLLLVTGVVALSVMLDAARAQTYPSRPVRMLVGSTPGAAPDIVARLFAQWLSEHFGQPFVIENRPAGGGSLAAEPVVRAPPDGYMLLVFSASNAIDVTLLDTLNFNIERDIAPVAGLVELPMLLSVNPAFPAKTLPQFIAYAKANPGKVNIGTPPVGSPQYVSGALLEMMSETKLAIIPYRGGPPAVTDALSGQIQGVVGTVLLVVEQIRSGGLRALAITSTKRSELLPAVPAMGEFLPQYQASQWIGIGAPKNTPTAVVDRLNAEINAALADPAMKAKVTALGGTVLPGAAGEFSKFVADEVVKWAKVVKFSGARPN
jgi:tripartite-type tricarboxylate transporter receptor subunit TctC